jgi:DNA polymerase elongation subunit (family B)
MSKYYTSVAIHGNNILYRGINNGRRVKEKVHYSPTLFLPSKKPTEWKTLLNEPLEAMKFETIRETRNFVKRYEDVANFKIYGNTRYEYAFIADTFRGNVDWDINDLSIVIIDIEVGSENGFPDPTKATEPITAIGVQQLNGGVTVYGCGEYKAKNDETYILCENEIDLCKRFLADWSNSYPDIVTGWNVKLFDIPYIINRFTRILGEDNLKKLSPWGLLNQRETTFKGKTQVIHEIIGVPVLDYYELYQWYAPNGKSQESYKLDNIASVELGENKLSFDEYDNLNQLYRLNHQKFIEYNIKDVELILKLEDKLKLIELALTLAYDTKTNYEDVFAQTRMWDALIYNYLHDKHIIVPPRVIQNKTAAFEGAYVKDPQVGLHNWVASFDLNSLYPHLIIQYNISPETLLESEDYTDEMREVLSQDVSVDALLMKRIDTSGLTNVTVTPNAQFFRTDKQGFLPKMMLEMYEDRKKYKKLMLKAQQDYEDEKDDSKKYEIEKLIARYNNLQLAKKVSLNSAYGAMGSQYFRFYDLRIALAVTSAGQLSIRWIENKLNEYLNNLLKTEIDYVIASDTDSIYLKLGPLVEKVCGSGGKVSMPTNKVIEFMDSACEEKLQPFIDESYKELAEYVHAFDQKMIMKREALADKGIWTAKKRYILNVYNNEGVQYNEPHLKVMGLEMIKSSTPYAVREKMRQLIKLIMVSDESEIQDFISEFRDKFKSLPAEDISFPRGLNGLTDYADSVTLYRKGTPIHVKGAILYNHYLKQLNLTNKYPLIQEGEKLKFTYLRTPNPFKDTVISYPTRLPKEFGLQEYIDYDTQFEKTFLEPIQVILNCLNWKAEKQATLESFFG